MSIPSNSICCIVSGLIQIASLQFVKALGGIEDYNHYACFLLHFIFAIFFLHFTCEWLQKIDIKYVSGTILTFSVVSRKLLVVINLTMLSALCAIPLWATIPPSKPSKLKRHKELKHKENTDSVEAFKAKRARYDMRGTLPALGFCLTSQPLLRASYEVSLIIAKAKAPHTAGEKLLKPSAVKMAQILLGETRPKE